MGYYATIDYAEFSIHQQDFDEALCLLKEFIIEHQTEYLYAPFYHALNKYSDFPAFIRDLGFDYEINNGYLSIVSFDSKYSCQKELFSVIVNLVTPASYMLFNGENDEQWGLLFTGTEIVEASHDITSHRAEKLKKTLQMVEHLDNNLPCQSTLPKTKI